MSKEYPVAENEVERLVALKKYDVLDTPAEEEFDRLTQLASLICGTPIALVSLIDEKRQWFKSKVGLGVDETPREHSFCQFAILEEALFSVEDATIDQRFKDNPLVTGAPEIKFYAGYPLIDYEGMALGTLCVIDQKPNKLNYTQALALQLLAEEVISQIVARQKKLELEKLEKLFDLSQDFVCITKLDGSFTRINPIFVHKLGYSMEYFLENPFYDLVHEEDLASTLAETEKLSQGRMTLDFVNRYRKKDGGYITLNWLATFDQNTKEVYAIARDVTDDKRILADLKESQDIAQKALNAKGEFLTNMSHEIRTPLNAIIGFNDLLERTVLDKEQKKYVSTVNIASQNLMVIVNDILDSAKLESGNVRLEEEIIELRELVDHIILLQSNSAKLKGIKLVLTYDENLPEFIAADQTRLTQILVNLLSNAIKFTTVGEVELKLEVKASNESDSTIRFSVRDTGIGIDKEKLTAIFSRFTQAESSTSRIYGGTGLGLNIVKMLVELYDGKLDVQSKLGEGSEFSFDVRFPIAGPGQSKVLLKGLSSSILKDIRILLVEDNEHNQLLATEYLNRKQAIIEVANNGAIAIERIREAEYDVVLLDLQMPVMDGYTATQIIRSELKSSIPIIACSAHSLVGEKEKCLELGMDDYIAKPYSERTLVNSILNCLNIDPLYADLDGVERGSAAIDDFVEIIKKMETEFGMDFSKSMIDIFKKRVPTDILKLEKGVESTDLDLIKESAHLFIGSLGSMGFWEGNKRAKEIQKYVMENDVNRVLSLTRDFINYLNQALKAIK